MKTKKISDFPYSESYFLPVKKFRMQNTKKTTLSSDAR